MKGKPEMINSLSDSRALDAALKGLGLKREEIYSPEAGTDGKLCCLNFKTDFQRYECIADKDSMELMGINSEPDSSGFFENYKYQSF